MAPRYPGRLGPRARTDSDTPEQLGLLVGELLVRDDALATEPVEGAQLLGDRRSRGNFPVHAGNARGWSRVPGPRPPSILPIAICGAGRAPELPARVHLAQLAIVHPLEGGTPAD